MIFKAMAILLTLAFIGMVRVHFRCRKSDEEHRLDNQYYTDSERRDWVVLYANGKYDIFMDHTFSYVYGCIDGDASIIPYKPVKD